MDKDISPEEKLLRLIRLRPKKTPGQAPQAKGDERRPEPKSRPAGPKINFSSSIIDALPQLKNIIFINKVLFFIFVALIAYFLIDYFLLPPVQIGPVSVESEAPEDIIKGEPVREPFSYYEKEIGKKDVFKPLRREEPKAEVEPEIELEEITANLSLLGIVSGANPQAIIQDNKKKKTYFLNEGDGLGEMTLKEILEAEGKVTLIYKNKEIDLGM